MDGEVSQSESTLSIPELEAQLTELTGHLNAATYRWLKLLAEFDRRNGWSDWHSCAHWLNHKCGVSLGAARQKVRVARALESLPKVSAAMAQGQLSYSKVRALTRVACPATEEDLLHVAVWGTAHHVETTVRLYRRAKEAEELSREARQQASRSVSYYYDEDGSLVLKARMPAETGAVLLKALSAAVESMPLPDVPAGTSDEKPSISARRTDALGLMAESFLQHGREELSGGDRHQIVVHVDAETLRDSTAGRCEIEDGPSIPAETARRMACDASIVMLIENDKGEPLNIGRKRRSIPPAIQRALRARDQGCRFTGCPNKHVQAHHVEHWAHGGETKLSNLLHLCHHHHHLVHEGKVVIQTLDDGAVRFLKPDGSSFDSIAPGHGLPLADWTDLTTDNCQHGVQIDERTAAGRWDGIPAEYWVVETMLRKARGAPGPEAAIQAWLEKKRSIPTGTPAVEEGTQEL